MRERLEKMLSEGRDDALLRFTLGEICLKEGELEAAMEHLRAAIEHKPDYSSAWRALGKAMETAGDESGALAVFDQGMGIAELAGDAQASKEMEVFARRLRKRMDEV